MFKEVKAGLLHSKLVRSRAVRPKAIQGFSHELCLACTMGSKPVHEHDVLEEVLERASQSGVIGRGRVNPNIAGHSSSKRRCDAAKHGHIVEADRARGSAAEHPSASAKHGPRGCAIGTLQ